MRKALRPAFVLLLVIAAVIVAEVLSGRGTQDTGRPAPALPAKVLVPPRVTLAVLRGEPAIVHFWASWCGPCRKEAPEIARLARHLGARGRLVGVDWSDSPGNARAFVREHGWRFPILEDRDGAVGNRYDLQGLPTTFILDARGRILRRLIGPQTERALLALLPRRKA